MSDIRSLGAHSLVYLVAQILNRSAQFLLIPVLARYLSAAEYGVYALVLVLYQIFMLLFSMGLGPALTRSQYDEESDQQRQDTVQTVATLITLVAVALSVLAIGPFRPVVRFLAGNIDFFPWIPLALGAAFGSVLLQIYLGVLQANSRSLQYAMLQLGHFVVQLGMAILLVVYFKMGLLGGVLGILSGAVYDLICGTFFLTQNRHGTFNKTLVKPLLKFGLPLVPHSIVAFLITATDRVMLSHFIDLDAVGTYSIGFQIASSVGLVLNALNLAWVPFAYGLIKNNDRDKLNRVSAKAGLLVLSLALGLTLIAHPLGSLMAGQLFTDVALQVTMICAIGFIFNGLYFLGVTHLFYQRKTGHVLLASSTAAIFNIVLNFLLIPAYGLLGPAMATSASFAILWAVVTISNWRLFGFLPPLVYWISGAIVAAILFAGSSQLLAMWQTTNLFAKLAAHISLAVPVSIILILPLISDILRERKPKQA